MSPKDVAPYNMGTALPLLLVAFTLGSSAYMYKLKGPIWFTWHPISMIASFVLLAALAILIKKAGGYTNTKIHMYLMVCAVVLAGFGWYVIYSNKEMYGKPHVVTLHAQLGVGVCLGYVGLALFGGLALNPDWGFLKTDKRMRFLHKWSGRVFTALAWVCCCYGFATLEARLEYQLAFAVPLVFFSVFVLM